MAIGDHVPAAGDIIKVNLVAVLGAQTALPGWHYRVVSQSGAGQSLNSIANTVWAALTSILASLLPPQAYWLKATARDITAHPIAPGEYSPGTIPGTDGLYPLPTQSSGILTLQTAKAGRAYRGRLYMPFPSEASTDSIALGEPNPTYLGKLDAFAAAVLTVNLTAGSPPDDCVLTPVIYHSSSGLWDDIVSSRSNPKWATQRRRGDYGRPNPPVA